MRGFAGTEISSLFREVRNGERVHGLFAEPSLVLRGCHVDFTELADADQVLEAQRSV